MSINPHDIDHLTGDTITMPPLHIYEDSQGQARLIQRAPVRYEAIAARATRGDLNFTVRTEIERNAWDRADWFTEKWTAFIDAEGESLTPLFDQVKREQEERVSAQAAPSYTITRLRRMRVADLRTWLIGNEGTSPDIVRDLKSGLYTKRQMLAIAREIIQGS